MSKLFSFLKSKVAFSFREVIENLIVLALVMLVICLISQRPMPLIEDEELTSRLTIVFPKTVPLTEEQEMEAEMKMSNVYFQRGIDYLLKMDAHPSLFLKHAHYKEDILYSLVFWKSRAEKAEILYEIKYCNTFLMKMFYDTYFPGTNSGYFRKIIDLELAGKI